MAVDFQLNRARLDFLHLERVEHPEDQVHNHQKGDQLLRNLLLHRAALPADNVRNEKRLKTDLYDTETGGD